MGEKVGEGKERRGGKGDEGREGSSTVSLACYSLQTHTCIINFRQILSLH